MDNSLLAATLVFIIPMCFSPGPNNVLCAAHGSQHGFKGTLTLISGMAVGWSVLGLFVGGATVFIEDNQEFFEILTLIGAKAPSPALKDATKKATEEAQEGPRGGNGR